MRMLQNTTFIFAICLWPRNDIRGQNRLSLCCDDSVCMIMITGPPNAPVLFCSLASVVWRHCLSASSSSVGVCNAADWRAGRRANGRSGGWYSTLHGGPVWLRPLERCLVINKRCPTKAFKRLSGTGPPTTDIFSFRSTHSTNRIFLNKKQLQAHYYWSAYT